MPTTKRKTSEKQYSYSEYLQKFRPKSLPEDEEPKRSEPFERCNGLVVDKTQDEQETDIFPGIERNKRNK